MATYDAIKTVGFLTNEKISNLKYTYIGSRCHTVRERENMKRFGANPLV